MARLGRSQPFRPLVQRRSIITPIGVEFDLASSSGYEASLSTYNWNHSVSTYANRVLIVSVSVFATGSVTSITYGGVNLTNIAAATVTNGIYRSEMWRLIAPAAGTGSIVVTLNASLTSIASAASYYNVDQTTPVEVVATNTGTNNPASGNLTTLANYARVVANLVTPTTSGVTSAAGQNSRDLNAGALGTAALDDKGVVTPPASTTVTWNGIGTLDTWAVSIISLQPPGTFVALSGSGITSGQGTLNLAFSLATSGSSSTLSAGSASVTFAITPTGQVSTGSAGTLTPAFSGLVLSGSGVTSGQGTLLSGFTFAIAGFSITSGLGSLALGTRTVALSGGSVATSGQGTIVPGNTQALASSVIAFDGTYATLDPLNNGPSNVLSNGNLTVTCDNSSANSTRGTPGKSSGKWYWEATVVSDGALFIGIEDSSADLANHPGGDSDGWAYYSASGAKFNSSSSAYGAAFTTGDVIGVALDMVNKTVLFTKNGTSQGVAYTGLTGTLYPAAGDSGGGSVITMNFGATAFQHAPPPGFNNGLYNITTGATTGTLSQGSLGAPLFTRALSGIAITGSAGTLGITFVVPLTGSASTTGTGTLLPVSGTVVALSGTGMTSGQGSLAISFGINIAGASSAIATGTCTAEHDVALTGAGGTGSIGSITVTLAPVLEGTTLTGGQGNVVASGGTVVVPVLPITDPHPLFVRTETAQIIVHPANTDMTITLFADQATITARIG